MGDFGEELRQTSEMAQWAATQARRAVELAQSGGADAAAAARIQQEHQEMQREIRDLRNVLSSMRMDRIGGGNGTPDIQRIENIPGERTPFDMLVEIPIDANDTSIKQGTITVSMEGPFVAVARYCTFLSQYQFQRKDPESNDVGTFIGRSNGRFRPIHSAADFNDGLLPGDVTRLVAFPGNGAPSYASPSNHSPYRSMETDFRCMVRKQDSGFPRSNVAVPSTFWTTFVNSPFQLGALDFYPRASVIEFSIQPQHTNNPRAGNLIGYGAGGVFPYVDSQYDHHEGIADPLDPRLAPGDNDPVTRLPKGVLIIGLHGYRITQPPGAVLNLANV
jgi:hypothetical protein